MLCKTHSFISIQP